MVRQQRTDDKNLMQRTPQNSLSIFTKSDGGSETIIAQAPTYFSNFSESITRTTTHPTQLSISKDLCRVKNLAAEI